MLEMAQVQAQLASTPAAQVIANHLGGFYELARIHLSQDPPRFDEASLAIDSMAGVLDAVEERLGQDGITLARGPLPAADGVHPDAARGRRRRRRRAMSSEAPAADPDARRPGPGTTAASRPAGSTLRR